MRILEHPTLRRILAVLGLILILGLLAGFIIVLASGGSLTLALGLFGCFTMMSVIMFIFLAYVRRNS